MNCASVLGGIRFYYFSLVRNFSTLSFSEFFVVFLWQWYVQKRDIHYYVEKSVVDYDLCLYYIYVCKKKELRKTFVLEIDLRDAVWFYCFVNVFSTFFTICSFLYICGWRYTGNIFTHPRIFIWCLYAINKLLCFNGDNVRIFKISILI